MANQISTIILNVDLECRNCSKKIKKTICKLQEREDIHTIAFDEKKNTVTISGPFDPEKICKKLCCKAGKVIKGIEIKDNKEKPKDADKPKDAKPADKPKDAKPADKPKDAKPADKPKDAKPADSAEPKKDKPKDAEPKKDKPKDAEPKKKDKDTDKPKEPEPKSEKPKDPEPKKNKVDPPPPELLKVNGPPAFVVPEPQFGYQPPVWQPGTSCGCGSGYGYGGYYGDNRCCWCGGGGGGGGGWAPVPQGVVYGAPAYKTCTYFSEEEPQSSCSVM